MQVQPEIAFRDVPRSSDIDALITKKVEKLNRLCPELISCRIAVEAPHNRHRTGNLYRVRVDMTVPEQELCVSNEEHDDDNDENLQAAIRLAFQRAERQLKAYVDRRRQLVKEHTAPAVGKVARIFPEQGNGYIETPDGREFFFDQESLLEGSIAGLAVGQEVSFAQTVDDRPSHAVAVVPTAGTD